MDEIEWKLLEEHEPLAKVEVDGVEIRKGDRVILRPKVGGDIFDIALAGQIAIIESIEEDYENNNWFTIGIMPPKSVDMTLVHLPKYEPVELAVS